jgi:tyrosine-specific transport protein
MTAIAQTASTSKQNFWAMTLLVSGSCIGGGMLALPVQTAYAGFGISFISLAICWAFMTYTGLLLVEATIWVKNEAHFSSLSRILVGKSVKYAALLIYLFMNYASLIAYTAGGAALIGHQIEQTLGLHFGYETCCILFTLLFGSMLWLGAQTIGSINFVLMGGLIGTYVCLLAFGGGHIEWTNLAFRPTWNEGAGILSIMLATYSYQMIVPSLCSQMNYDASQLKKAIVVGTTIPFIAYSLWIAVIHGVVPLESLISALDRGASATEPLGMHFSHWSLTLLSDGFAFFALTTSYLGLSLALFYFLKDCFNEFNVSMSRSFIILTSIIPTLFLAILFPNALITCLDLSGGFGDTLLSGLIPISMVWMGRYRKKLTGEFTVPGGKPALILAGLFYLFIFFKQL